MVLIVFVHSTLFEVGNRIFGVGGVRLARGMGPVHVEDAAIGTLPWRFLILTFGSIMPNSVIGSRFLEVVGKTQQTK